MRKLLLVVLVAGSPWLSLPAAAQQSTADEIAAIRGEIATLVARLDRLEQGSTTNPAGSAVVAAAPVVDVPPRLPARPRPTIKFAGDLRYRHESFNDDFEGDASASGFALDSA
jgi:hypothetical protein